jgi:dihydrofolate synthase/folylpolyglutamate synthase
VLSRTPLTLLDAAHNPQGAGVLSGALRTSFGPRRFVGVLATLSDKDALGVLRELEPVLEEVVITKSTSARALPVFELEDLAIEVFGEHRVRTADHFASAIEDARAMVGDGIGDSIIITGSVSLVGDVLKMQQTEAELEARDDDWAEKESDHDGSRSNDLDYEDEQFN